MSETQIRLFIIVTLFLTLSSFLIGLVSLVNFAFPTLAAVITSLSTAVFLVVYVIHSGFQILPRYYPMIVGFLDGLLGFIVLCICLPNFGGSVYNFVNYSDHAGVAAVNLAGFVAASFGIVASTFGLIGSLSSIMKKSYSLAQLGSYMVLGWFSTLFISLITPSIVLLGAPTPYAYTVPQLIVNLVAFTTLFILPSLLCVILVRRSRMEFA